MNHFVKFCMQTNTLLNAQSLRALINPSRSVSVRTTEIANVEKKLGFPERPRRPTNPYMRFVKEVRPTLQNLNKRKQCDVVVELAALWRAQDDATKAIYKQQFEKETIIYKEKMAEYKSKITKEQTTQFKNELMSLQEDKKIAREKKEQKAHAAELGKPKFPLSSFILFANELRNNSTTKIHSTEVASKWKAFSDAERRIYTDRSTAAFEQYKKDLKEWKEKMQKAGHVILSQMQRRTNPKN